MGTPIRFVRLIFQSAVLAVGNDIAALPILRDFISQLDEGCERLPYLQYFQSTLSTVINVQCFHYRIVTSDIRISRITRMDTGIQCQGG